MIQNYRKKPVVIQACQWNGNNRKEIESFVNNSSLLFMGPTLIIKTLEGNHEALIGDYIIKGVANEYYPCKPEIFEKTYELA